MNGLFLGGLIGVLWGFMRGIGGWGLVLLEWGKCCYLLFGIIWLF
jgi:hypothetical protein